MTDISTGVQLKPGIGDGTVYNGNMSKDTLVNRSPNPENPEKGQASSPRTQISVEDNEESTTEYPSSWKLAMIMISLCLAVFCLALVSHSNVIYTSARDLAGLTVWYLIGYDDYGHSDPQDC